MPSCPICSKIFSRKSVVERHKQLHTGVKPFICKYCSKAFTQKCTLTRHFKIHSGKKTFNCAPCKKEFSRRDHFNQHLRIHTGSKPFECRLCSKRFSQKSSLTKHWSAHSKAKPFKCLICLKAFGRRDHYNRHQRSHCIEAQVGNFLEKTNLEVSESLFDSVYQSQKQQNVEFFLCKKELRFMALFDDFADNRAFKTTDGCWKVSTRRNRLSNAKRFGEVTNFVDCEVTIWDGTSDLSRPRLKQEVLEKRGERVNKLGTDVRSNWRTLPETWDEIASWESRLTGKRTFDFLRGKTILEATTSDGFSTNYLRRNKKKFGFADVLGCSNFFEYSLRERDSFDAVVSNPLWDEHFLKVFYLIFCF